MFDDTNYAAVTVGEAMLWASYGVYHECDADKREANVTDYDMERNE